MSSSPTSSSSSEPPPGPGVLLAMADVICGVDFVIGSGRMKIRDFLRLGSHSVVRLDEAAGSDLELRVNGIVLAQGEVAVMDDSAALRVTRIAMPAGVGWD